MHEHLIKLVSTYQSLSREDIKLCNEYFEPVFIPKSRVLEEEEKVPKYLYFIISGYVRVYHFNDVGDEITTHINCPPGFITSYFDFVQQTPSKSIVESLTESELLRITKPNVDELMSKSEAFKNFSIAIFNQSLVYNENRARELATLSAADRYAKLVNEHPDIVQNVPVQYIASFLGMKAESLSRIRKQLVAS